MRQVHLDFHTGPTVRPLAARFDPEDFVATLRAARVNSVTVFAQCHHGHTYFPSDVVKRHPALTFDLLGAQLDALHAAGIRAPIYLTVGWNDLAGRTRPEWLQVRADGTPGLPPEGEAPLGGWPKMCVAGGYADQIEALVRELLGRYRCDGFFFDIVGYGEDSCLCEVCSARIRSAGGDPADRDAREANNTSNIKAFTTRMSRVIRAANPGAAIYFNGPMGARLAPLLEDVSHVDVESLPTGGWGYGFYPLWSRWARRSGLPVVGMTGRFAITWSDVGGLKHPDALRYEAATILAAGGAVSIGDQLHPDGRLDAAVYDVIGQALADVERVEPFIAGSEPAPWVAILETRALTRGREAGSGALEAAARMLGALHHDFDVVLPGEEVDLSSYQVVILPDDGPIDGALASAVNAFVAAGGALLVTARAGLDAEGGSPLADALGLDPVGPARSNPDYFRICDSRLCGPAVMRDFAYYYALWPTFRMAAREGVEILATASETAFDRSAAEFSGHSFTPADRDDADYPAITLRGRCAYFHGPIFTAYESLGSVTLLELLGGILDLLVPDRPLVTDAHASTEVTMRTRGPDRLVHVVNFSPQRRGSHVEVLGAPIPLTGVTVGVLGSFTDARCLRSGASLAVTERDGRSWFTVPRVEVSEIVELLA